MPATVQLLGAVAGLASGVGLVVLSALYVSHAREVERLRDWAGGAPEAPRAVIASPRTDQATSRAPQDAPIRARRGGRRTGARLAAFLAGVVAVGAVPYGVGRMVAGGGGGSVTPRPSAQKPRRSAVLKPGAITVAVLNGTTVNGLAAALRDRTAAAGFQKGTIDVFSDQQLAQSVVEYAPGHLAAAKAVGRVLGIGRYGPVTADTRALGGADATVIVIAGADQAP